VRSSDLLAVRGRDSSPEESFPVPESARQRRHRAVQKGSAELQREFEIQLGESRSSASSRGARSEG